MEKANKTFSLHLAEGCRACSLSREHFLPDLTVKGTCKTLIRPLVQQPTALRSIERILQMNDIARLGYSLFVTSENNN